MNEIWKDIPDYEGSYQVSSKGNVRSLPRTTTQGGILKQQINKRNGYCYVALSHKGRTQTRRVHRLVANAFLGKSELQVNHIDGDKTHNSIDNLEYCTQSQNMQHAYRMGLEKPKGIAVINLNTLEVFDTATEAARSIAKTKCGGEAIARVCRGERSHYRNQRFAFLTDYLSGSIPPFKGKYKKKGSETLWR